MLGIKATGQNPHVLPDSVQSTLDLSMFYRNTEAAHAGGITNAVNATGVFGTSPLWPQPGELWVVNSFAIIATANLLAATSIRFRACIYEIVDNDVTWVSPTFASGAVGELPALGGAFDGPLLVPAGYGLAAWVEQIAVGTAPTLRISGRIAKLKV
jgi:hypothetical protein